MGNTFRQACSRSLIVLSIFVPPTQSHHQKSCCFFVLFCLFKLSYSSVFLMWRGKCETKKSKVKCIILFHLLLEWMHCVWMSAWEHLSFSFLFVIYENTVWAYMCSTFTCFPGRWRWHCPLHIPNGKGSRAPTLTQLICLQRKESEMDRSQVDMLPRFINHCHTRSTITWEGACWDRDPGQNYKSKQGNRF